MLPGDQEEGESELASLQGSQLRRQSPWPPCLHFAGLNSPERRAWEATETLLQGVFSLWVAPFGLERGGDGDASLTGHRWRDQSPGWDSMNVLPPHSMTQRSLPGPHPPPRQSLIHLLCGEDSEGRLSSRNTISSSWKALLISSGFPLEDALLFSISGSFSLSPFSLHSPVSPSPPFSFLSTLPCQSPISSPFPTISSRSRTGKRSHNPGAPIPAPFTMPPPPPLLAGSPAQGHRGPREASVMVIRPAPAFVLWASLKRGNTCRPAQLEPQPLAPHAPLSSCLLLGLCAPHGPYHVWTGRLGILTLQLPVLTPTGVLRRGPRFRQNARETQENIRNAVYFLAAPQDGWPLRRGRLQVHTWRERQDKCPGWRGTGWEKLKPILDAVPTTSQCG